MFLLISEGKVCIAIMYLDNMVKVIDVQGVITLTLTVCTFMLAYSFLGKGSNSIGLFWGFLGIGVASIIAFFLIEKQSEIPLISLKLAFNDSFG